MSKAVRQTFTDTSFKTRTVSLADIDASGRYRQDFGDLSGLEDSINKLGLLQPLVARPLAGGRYKLVAGARRFRALMHLGHTEVSVHVVDSLDDTLAALRAERDENTCRKDFTPSEGVAIGRAIEQMEKKEAEQRQKATQAKPGDGAKLREGKSAKADKPQDGNGGGNFPPPSTESGKTRDKVAEAVGMSGRTYEKARAVVQAAEKDPERFGPVAAEMDATGKVEPAFQKVKTELVDGTRASEIKVKGVGTVRAHEAINCLMRIPKNDALRKRGFQIVTDWIRRNR